jgi:hypothetical protein
LDVYVGEFERTGFTGALNRYRNVDRDWEDLAAYDGAAITQPSLFIGGALDASDAWIQNVIDSFSTTMPGLVNSHSYPAAAIWYRRNAQRTSTRSSSTGCVRCTRSPPEPPSFETTFDADDHRLRASPTSIQL